MDTRLGKRIQISLYKMNLMRVHESTTVKIFGRFALRHAHQIYYNKSCHCSANSELWSSTLNNKDSETATQIRALLQLTCITLRSEEQKYSVIRDHNFLIIKNSFHTR
jgi:hypothetical protein